MILACGGPVVQRRRRHAASRDGEGLQDDEDATFPCVAACADRRAMATGQGASQFADVVSATSFAIDEGLTNNAKALAASFCDYVRDLMDVDDVPVSSRPILRDLRENGASVY